MRYIGELEDCCQHLAGRPASGRSCGHLRPGIYRMEVGKHVTFFRHEPTGILVSRILHGRMLPGRRAFNDEGGCISYWNANNQAAPHSSAQYRFIIS
jgi:plasmid stabilization system protein ParE